MGHTELTELLLTLGSPVDETDDVSFNCQLYDLLMLLKLSSLYYVVVIRRASVIILRLRF